MMLKIVKSLLICVVMICIVVIAAFAQNNSNCVSTYTFGPFGNYPGPGWQCHFIDDHGPFAFLVECTKPNATCPPLAGPSETNKKGSCPTCNAASPINLVTGNTFVEENDVKIPGLSNGLTLTRIWNSQWPPTQSASQIGLFGPNWRSTFEERIFFGNDGYYKYSRGDGSFWSFGSSSSGWKVVAPANDLATLVANSNYTFWTLTFQNGEQRIFNYASGYLTTIIDRNGNTTQLSYDSLNRLVTVTDPGGRHLYFSYPNNTSYLVTTITSDVGISLSYSYDSNGRLAQITKPDQTILSISYDSNSMIAAVTDSSGKVLESHTYDSCGRGLTSSRAGGVEAVTVSYAQPCWQPPIGEQ